MLNWKTFAIGCSLALALLLIAQRKPTMPDPNAYRAVIDLTHDLNDHSPNWEGSEQSPFQVRNWATLSATDTTRASLNDPGTLRHPPRRTAHFAKGTWTVDQIPVERLVRPLVVLDVRSKAKSNPDYQISVQDIADWENAHLEKSLPEL